MIFSRTKLFRFRLLFYIVFTLFSFVANAQRQDNNTLHFGVGMTRYNAPGVAAATFYGEYSKPFFPRSVVGISAEAVLPVDFSTQDEDRTMLSYRFGMNLYYEILDEREQQFKAGAGFVAGFFSTDWVVIGSDQNGTDNDFQPGFAAQLEYNFIFNEVFILGLTGKAFVFDNDKSAFFAGLHGGFRF